MNSISLLLPSQEDTEKLLLKIEQMGFKPAKKLNSNEFFDGEIHLEIGGRETYIPAVCAPREYDCIDLTAKTNTVLERLSAVAMELMLWNSRLQYDATSSLLHLFINKTDRQWLEPYENKQCDTFPCTVGNVYEAHMYRPMAIKDVVLKPFTAQFTVERSAEDNVSARYGYLLLPNTEGDKAAARIRLAQHGYTGRVDSLVDPYTLHTLFYSRK